jgi:hypothetical protein
MLIGLDEISPGLDVSSFMPSSLYTEVGALPWPTRLITGKQLTAWRRTEHEPIPDQCWQHIINLSCGCTVQGPTPGALQEMLDGIDRYTEQVTAQQQHLWAL